MTPLKKLRTKANIQISEICKYLHIGRIQYWRIETQNGGPSYKTALKIVEFFRLRGLQISTEEIFFPDKRKAKAARKLAA